MVSHMVQLLPKHSQSMWGWGKEEENIQKIEIRNTVQSALQPV